jgi:hypothetical protein
VRIEMYGDYEVDESHWDGAGVSAVKRLNSLDELKDDSGNIWTEPFIVSSDVLNSYEFVRIPHNQDITEFLSDKLGRCTVTVGEECSSMFIIEWYHRHRHDPDMYLRDLHVNRIRKGFRLFETPHVFPDWISEYCKDCTTRDSPQPVLDSQFLYWGAKGSHTPFHRDVMGTFSWSHNLRGQKYWKFFMPDNRVLECMQTPGETVFVPSQCFHTVENRSDDTISVNQNWINENNIHQVAEQLVSDTAYVRKDLLDYKATDPEDVVDQAESIVWANNALNLINLIKIIEFSLRKRNVEEISPFGKHNLTQAVELIQTMYPSSDVIKRIQDRLG